MKNLKKGFTLIELLIVIAILGILAIVVLSALNPIEQINKSRDSGNISDAEQLQGAFDRYFASKGIYPWQATAAAATTLPMTTQVKNSWIETGGAVPVLTNLSTNTTELKRSFVDRLNQTSYNTLYVYNRGQVGDATYVCFEPKSDAFNNEANARCAATLVADFPAAACPANCAATDACFTCLP